MTEAQLTIIIINWKLKETTLACLRSLEQVGLPHRVIVVDNGSHDGSIEFLAHHAPHVELFPLPENFGFGRACNLAIRRVLADPASEFVLILNNDATIEPQTVAALLAAARAHPEAGILGPKIFYQDRPEVFWSAGARRRRTVLAAADTGRGQSDRGQFDTRGEVDYIFGTAMLIRREVFEQVGMFDERFFLYLEDLDLCLRVQRGGFTLRLVPEARLWHSVSASTHRRLGMRRYHLVKSTILFLRKHTTPGSFALMLVFWPLVAARFLLADLCSGHLALHHYGAGIVAGLSHEARPSLGGRFDECQAGQLTVE